MLRFLLLASIAIAGLTGAAIIAYQSARPSSLARDPAFARAALLRAVGKSMFTDATLSATGKQSCASCHDPARRYNPPNDLDVQPGGDGHSLGFRAPPTLTYLNRIPAYDNHHHESDEEGDESIDAGPTGGLTWDGRVDRGEKQARIPLLAPFEMGGSVASVANAIRAAAYATPLRKALGARVLDSDDDAFAAGTRALGAFEQDYDEFNPYTSKYDAYLTHNTDLDATEKRGLELFEDPAKGNCAACHISRRALDGTAPALSDYGLIALAVPRNPGIARNHDPAFFDLGACGPERKDKAGQAGFCGLFRTPTLRNVALRHAFFHNGVLHTLRDVVAFYVTRDITPERWYPHDHQGRVQPYDDLPPAYDANINRDAPFAGQHPGAKPRLDAGEIDAVVAFLGTLTDGYLKTNPYRAERSRAAVIAKRWPRPGHASAAAKAAVID